MVDELIKIENGCALLDVNTQNKLAEFERLAKDIKAKEDELKQMILAEMESKSILKIDTPELLISYVAPTTREQFDGKRFREDCPDVYDEYISITPVKASVRIKVK